jgi:L-iditol 2-dehydrogenase
VTIVCIGKSQLVDDALGLVRKGGSVDFFAGLSGEGWAELEANRIHYDQLRVAGVSDSSRSDYGAALGLIRSGGVDVSRMVTHHFPSQRSTPHWIRRPTVRDSRSPSCRRRRN